MKQQSLVKKRYILTFKINTKLLWETVFIKMEIVFRNFIYT